MKKSGRYHIWGRRSNLTVARTTRLSKLAPALTGEPLLAYRRRQISVVFYHRPGQTCASGKELQ